MTDLRYPSIVGPTRPTRFGVVLLALSLLVGVRAAAADYRTQTIGAWTVSASRDGRGCFITRSYDGPGDTTVLLGLDGDGSNHLTVLNANWSIEPRDRLKLDFRLSTGSYARHAAVGIASEEKQGFVTNFEAKFPAYFGGSKFLHISRGDTPVEQLDLAGSGAAVAALRSCADLHRTDAAADGGRKARSARIPIDPFAPESKARAKEK